MRLLVCAALAAISWCGMARAQDRATAADAQTLLDKAVAHYHDVGRDQAFRDFAIKDGAFFMRDLYVYCDRDGQPPILSFHPIAKGLVNKTLETVVDSTGKPFGVALLREALANGTAQSDYAWPDPATRKIEPKTALAAKVSADEVCVVGYYH